MSLNNYNTFIISRFSCLSSKFINISFLIVGFILYPTTRIPAENESAALVIDEDEGGEGQSWEPPIELQRVHSKTLVHPWGV